MQVHVYRPFHDYVNISHFTDLRREYISINDKTQDKKNPVILPQRMFYTQFYYRFDTDDIIRVIINNKEVNMKGDVKVIDTLNDLLARELTVVNQYMVHAEMCENWGYGKLHEMIQKRAITEMKHAETLIARIIFLEGIPVVSELEKIHIGADVPKMFDNDHEAELDAVKRYNAAIVVCGNAKDFATREILEHILNEEDDHVDTIEEVLDEIDQMGIQVFLSTKVS